MGHSLSRELLTPFVSGVEFVGGHPAPGRAVHADRRGAADRGHDRRHHLGQVADVDSLETLLGFEETSYLALFLWLAVDGPGPLSLDRLLTRSRRTRTDPLPSA